jgi:hypothetical protein
MITNNTKFSHLSLRIKQKDRVHLMLTLMLVEMDLMMQETKEGSSQVVLTQVLPDKMHQRQQATL